MHKLAKVFQFESGEVFVSDGAFVDGDDLGLRWFSSLHLGVRGLLAAFVGVVDQLDGVHEEYGGANKQFLELLDSVDGDPSVALLIVFVEAAVDVNVAFDVDLEVVRTTFYFSK